MRNYPVALIHFQMILAIQDVSRSSFHFNQGQTPVSAGLWRIGCFIDLFKMDSFLAYYQSAIAQMTTRDQPGPEWTQ